MYVKLPARFKIPTPLGSYNPDWALVIEKNGEQNVYFVVETKSKHTGLVNEEYAKTLCGKVHFISFKDLDTNPAIYMKSTSLEEVLSSL